MEKINLVELLKDCPKGMELDCTMYEDAKFMEVDTESDSIILRVGNKFIRRLNKYGQDDVIDCAKCVIFPKGKTTWEGFVPPCKFKDGDIVYIKTNGHNHNEFIIIFKEIKNDHIHKHACFAYQVLYTSPNAVCHLVDIEEIRIATEEEKEKLFDAIKANGFKWNSETKTLEKNGEIKPKFKVGDKIKHKCEKFRDERTIVSYGKRGYWTSINDWIDYKNQDDWELVSDKFDITTLKPFSKVLVRDSEVSRWKPSFFGFYDIVNRENYPYICVGSSYAKCIPYNDETKHLLGQTDDCDEYYKTWK